MSEAAALGYMILAAKQYGMTNEEIENMEKIMDKIMDEANQEMAEEVYIQL